MEADISFRFSLLDDLLPEGEELKTFPFILIVDSKGEVRMQMLSSDTSYDNYDDIEEMRKLPVWQ